jgi:hypothetical protein
MGCKQSKHQAPLYTTEPEIDDDNKKDGGDDYSSTDQTPRELRKIREELFNRDSMMAVASSETERTEISFDDCSLDDKRKRSSDYHYPAALYHDIKSLQRFVPKSQHAQEFPKLRHVRSVDSDDSSSAASSILDYINEREMFPQFEALVDTMALSLEPQGKKSANVCSKPVMSFRALVDQLTELEEEDFANSDGDDTAKAEKQNSACTVASKGRTKRANGAARNRHSAPPVLETKLSSEILADIKTMALMADISDDRLLESHHAVESKRKPRNNNILSACAGNNNETIKFHHTHSSSDNNTVCSELSLGRWM